MAQSQVLAGAAVPNLVNGGDVSGPVHPGARRAPGAPWGPWSGRWGGVLRRPGADPCSEPAPHLPRSPRSLPALGALCTSGRHWESCTPPGTGTGLLCPKKASVPDLL